MSWTVLGVNTWSANDPSDGLRYYVACNYGGVN